jgi:hypothetical protein
MSRDPERESRRVAMFIAGLVLATAFWIAMIAWGWPKPCKLCQNDSSASRPEWRQK